jgi:AcrR family transcriptional regulator
MMKDQASKAVPKANRKSQIERTELSDSRMLDVCIKLIVDEGTDRTTLKAVGEKAGYSRGLAGVRFKSKAGLFCFVIKAVADQWRIEMEKLTSGKIGYPAISAAIDAHHQFCQKTPKSFQAFYILWFESIGEDNDMRDVVVSIHQRRLCDVTKWIEQAIEAGQLQSEIDAESVARYFLTTMFGIVYQWLIKSNQANEISFLHDQLKMTMRVLLPAARPANKGKR